MIVKYSAIRIKGTYNRYLILSYPHNCILTHQCLVTEVLICGIHLYCMCVCMESNTFQNETFSFANPIF